MPSLRARNRLAPKLFTARSLLRNFSQTHDVWYIVESADWAIRAVGQHIIAHLNSHTPLSSALTVTPRGLKASLVHFGSLPTLFTQHGMRLPHPSCSAVASFFHSASPSHIERMRLAAQEVDRLHVSTTAMANQLISVGVERDRIITIPLGVDDTLFHPPSEKEQQLTRARLTISSNTFVIGSFQKDGIGWGGGESPKLEKGPDILVETLTRVASHYPIHVLLAGPARGYVTRRLKERRIPHTALGYVTSTDLAASYHALDAYLITSRVEGGPLSLLEAWASGVPVVTTNVGLASDFARHGENTLVAHDQNAEMLAEHMARLIEDAVLRQRLSHAAQQLSLTFAWPRIAEQYYEKLYRPLLAS
jgi:glycosyltransferase involved in cell wall biosynthesis